MATLGDVARQAGVSVSVASRVLSDAPEARVSAETRSRVRDAASALDYRPNFAGRALRAARTDVVALVVPDLTNAFATELMLGVEDEARARGYTVLLGRSEDLEPDGELVSRLFGEGRVDAMLVQVPDDRSPDEVAALVRERYPVVFLHALAEGHGGVLLDDAAGARLATEHLLGLGHQRVAMAGGLPNCSTADRRADGFGRAVTAAGLSPSAATLTRLGYRPEEGRAALRQLTDASEPPTGLVVANLNAAIGVLGEARRLGLRVPEDLSVVAVHDAWTAENTWPPLTTVRLPMYSLGRTALAAAHERLLGGGPRAEVVADPAPELVLRGSTAAPPRAG